MKLTVLWMHKIVLSLFLWLCSHCSLWRKHPALYSCSSRLTSFLCLHTSLLSCICSLHCSGTALWKMQKSFKYLLVALRHRAYSPWYCLYFLSLPHNVWSRSSPVGCYFICLLASSSNPGHGDMLNLFSPQIRVSNKIQGIHLNLNFIWTANNLLYKYVLTIAWDILC